MPFLVCKNMAYLVLCVKSMFYTKHVYLIMMSWCMFQMKNRKIKSRTHSVFQKGFVCVSGGCGMIFLKGQKKRFYRGVQK
jgi:hypothetical protein